MLVALFQEVSFHGTPGLPGMAHFELTDRVFFHIRSSSETGRATDSLDKLAAL